MKNLLKEIRMQNGLLQKEVASALGVAQTTYSHWEQSGNLPPSKYLTALAEYFNVPVSAFTQGSLPVAPLHTRIPVLGVVAAGIPMMAEENIIDWEEISSDMASKGEYFALQVTGDSMLPYIAPGDVLIVRQCSVVRSGAVAIVLVNGNEGTCKKIYFRENGIELRAYNPDVFPNKLFTRKEVATLPVTVCGEVVEVRKKALP